MPPVEVPPIKSNISYTLRPVRASNSFSMRTVTMPRMPPPSMDRILSPRREPSGGFPRQRCTSAFSPRMARARRALSATVSAAGGGFGVSRGRRRGTGRPLEAKPASSFSIPAHCVILGRLLSAKARLPSAWSARACTSVVSCCMSTSKRSSSSGTSSSRAAASLVKAMLATTRRDASVMGVFPTVSISVSIAWRMSLCSSFFTVAASALPRRASVRHAWRATSSLSLSAMRTTCWTAPGSCAITLQ
mmetsp:Transcript_29749/g.74838  ORF Transcript_29749/g.74838 Transcript_29749/m.74838 type:complete len:247 (+) Transcript_29749:2138-2878(+)